MDYPFVFEKCKVFWMSDVDDSFNGGNVLSVKATQKQDTSVWRASFLIFDSRYTDVFRGMSLY
jgi:hypothetical protein